MKKRNEKLENEFRSLEEELMFRVPPPFGSYIERREQMKKQAISMRDVGQILMASGKESQGAESLITKSDKLLASMGVQDNDSDKI